MKIQHHRIFCAALLAVILLLTAAGCAAEKPASGAPERAPAQTNAGPVRLSESGNLTQIPEEGETGAPDPDEGETETLDVDETETLDVDETETSGIDETEPPAPAETETLEIIGAETQGAELTLAGDSQAIELVKDSAIKEGEEPVLTVALTGLVFADRLDRDQFRWENLPQGIEFTVARVDGATVEITLSGTPAEAVEETQLRLTIGKSQFQTPPEADVTVDGSVTVAVTGASGGISPAILAVCGGAAAVVVAAVAAALVVSSGKKKGARGQQDVPVAAISRTENIRREPERRDMPSYQDKKNTAQAVPGQGVQPEDQKNAYGAVQLGKLHNIGRRSSQQDSSGSMSLDGGTGVFAVVADGMGGLSGGDQVSQGVVMSMLQQAGSLRPGQMDGVLSAMVRSANEEINRKLGPDGIYRSGSTVVAVLVRGNVFHWISVGDSRIYLYRGGSMLQLNQEHTYEMELMQRVMNGEITAAEAANDPQRRGLTSFIGMGRLKYVDASLRPIVLQSGDRILLMTDGVFNNLPESAMADILHRNPNVQQAAKVLEEQVLALQDAAQDNFTAIVLGF